MPVKLIEDRFLARFATILSWNARDSGVRNMLKTQKVVEEFMQYIVSTIQVVLRSGPNQNHHYFPWTFGLAHVNFLTSL